MTGLSLPKKCGVMLLPDCTLFPQGGLPLHIFEERYREMLDDALAAECIFAVGRLHNGEISPIGTAGLVRASREQGDGTSNLLLHGVIRVRFLEWLDGRSYPLALIEPLIPEPMSAKAGLAAIITLRGAVEDAITGLPDALRQGVMELLDQAEEPGVLADLVAQQFVHDPDVRQRLLEMASVGERISSLCRILDVLRGAG